MPSKDDLPRTPTTSGTWETASGKKWPHEGRAPRWPDDYPPTCDCNPPAHTGEQINLDGSFHSRTCPEHPTRVSNKS